jgi:hypothetical protein
LDGGLFLQPTFGAASLSLETRSDGSPTITLQPQSQAVLAGAHPIFNIMANGTQPIHYQWRLNGTDLAGATSAVLALNDVQPIDAGDYSVVVNNLSGSVTSRVAQLSVLFPPTVSVQPTNTVVSPGTSVTFSVVANGTAPLSYQWRRNGVNVPGATNSFLTIANA